MTHTSAMQKAREIEQAWLDGGCSSWGLPADDIRALISETAAKDAENASLRKKVEEMEASFDARVQEMSENFRAVNIERVIAQCGTDILALRDRATRAEKALAFYAASDTWYSKPHPSGYADCEPLAMQDKGALARATLTQEPGNAA